MRIISFTAENVKRLRAAEIRPDGMPVVQITGKNGQGKSSVLDALWWAVTGKKNIEDVPIRTGAQTAKTILEIGDTQVELVVTRTYRTNEDGKTVSDLLVETGKGAVIKSPQTLLDSLIGSIAFDPLEFSRSDDKRQFDILKRFVPGYDFEMSAINRAADFTKRTDVNRKVDEAKMAAARIVIPIDAPIVQVDEAAILEKLRNIAEQNEETQIRSANRKRLADSCAAKRARCVDIEGEIRELFEKVESLKAEGAVAAEEADAGERKILAADKLPEILTTESIMAELEKAKADNRSFASRIEKDSYIADATALQAQADTLTAAIERRDKEKADAIARAALPIPGLGIGDGIVLFNALPFRQASDAERLRVSIAIAMASHPKLRIIRVRDGSLLDADAMTLLETMAIDNDYQVWIERVDGSGKVGFVLEDGFVVTRVDPDLIPKKVELPPNLVTTPKPAAAPVKPSTSEPSERDNRADRI